MRSYSNVLKSVLSVFCLAVLLSGKADAAPILLKELGLSSGMQTGNLTLPVSGSPQSYFAGLQNLQIDNDAIVQAFCIDPFQWSPTSNASYEVSNDFAGYFGADAGDIAKLYSLFYTSTLGNNLNAAGFQLALWELIADSSKNLAAGLVHSNTGTNASIKATAQGMLDALSGPGGTDFFTYTIFTSSSKQDYLLVRPGERQVPEPQSAVLLLLALGLLGAGLRRRH